MSEQPLDVAGIIQKFGLARKRVRLIVEVDLDPVPGWGNTGEDFRAYLQRNLDDGIGHYHPIVEFDGEVAR